jgi:hypothetical protein
LSKPVVFFTVAHCREVLPQVGVFLLSYRSPVYHWVAEIYERLLHI